MALLRWTGGPPPDYCTVHRGGQRISYPRKDPGEGCEAAHTITTDVWWRVWEVLYVFVYGVLRGRLRDAGAD